MQVGNSFGYDLLRDDQKYQHNQTAAFVHESGENVVLLKRGEIPLAEIKNKCNIAGVGGERMNGIEICSGVLASLPEQIDRGCRIGKLISIRIEIGKGFPESKEPRVVQPGKQPSGDISGESFAAGDTCVHKIDRGTECFGIRSLFDFCDEILYKKQGTNQFGCIAKTGKPIVELLDDHLINKQTDANLSARVNFNAC